MIYMLLLLLLILLLSLFVISLNYLSTNACQKYRFSNNVKSKLLSLSLSSSSSSPASLTSSQITSSTTSSQITSSTTSSQITSSTTSKGFGTKPVIDKSSSINTYEKSRSEKKKEYRELVKIAKQQPSLKKMVASAGKAKDENFGGQRKQGVGGY